MRSSPLNAYLAPARTLPGAWRPVLGMMITIGVYILGMILVVFGWLLVQWGLTGDLHQSVQRLGVLAEGKDKQGTLITLLSFIGIWAGLALVLVVLHGQSFGTLFDPERRVRMGDFGRGLMLAVVFSAGSLIVAGLVVGAPVRAQPVGSWAVFLVPLMVLVFIQATAEELVFRGYLLQQLGTRFASPIAWAVIPAALFGLLHAWNTTGEAAYYYVAITAITGVTFAVLVWRTGNLWAAIGMHWGVNMISLTGVGAEGVLSGTQLWLFPADAILPLLQVDVVASLILLALVLSPAGLLLGDAHRPIGTTEQPVFE